MSVIVRNAPLDTQRGTHTMSSTRGKMAPALATQRGTQSVPTSIGSGQDGDRFDKCSPKLAAGG